MAGSGRRTFAAGEVLTASNVMNYLQDQAVMVFADSTARTAAMGTSASEGMISYLQDTNFYEVYSGSTWNKIFSTDKTVRIENTNDVSVSSTNHGFQIGLDSGTNLRMDNNEIICANNGTATIMYLNNDGGNIGLGGAASTAIIAGRIDANHYPWAISAGTTTTSASANVAVTSPGGGNRFSVAPIVIVTSVGGANAVTMPYVASVTATNFNVSLYTTAGARVAQVVHWNATQMSSGAAQG